MKGEMTAGLYNMYEQSNLPDASTSPWKLPPFQYLLQHREKSEVSSDTAWTVGYVGEDVDNLLVLVRYSDLSFVQLWGQT